MSKTPPVSTFQDGYSMISTPNGFAKQQNRQKLGVFCARRLDIYRMGMSALISEMSSSVDIRLLNCILSAMFKAAAFLRAVKEKENT